MNEDHLRELLKTWRVEPEVPPRFQAGVWERIAAENQSAWYEPLLEWLLLPKGMTSAIAASVVVGAMLALFAAQMTKTQMSEQLEAQYFRSINPYAQVAHG